MSFPVWYEIVCEECATTADGGFTRKNIPRRSLKKAAEHCGWIFWENLPFCSERCLFKRKNRLGEGEGRDDR